MLFVLDLAGDSNHHVIPLFLFRVLQIKQEHYSCRACYEVDPEADKNEISNKWEKALWPPSFIPSH